MEYRPLGNTGLNVSAIALGCEGFMGKSPDEVKHDFDHAIALGINFLDLYSPNPDLHRALARALRDRHDRFHIQGHLCTTWENGQYLRTRDLAKVRNAFSNLLRNLEVDRVDVGMIHYVDNPEDLQQVLHGGIMDFALEQQRAGRIGHIGISSHNPVVALQAAQTGLVQVIMFSINPAYDLQPADIDIDALFESETFQKERHNIDPYRRQLYQYCAANGIGIDVMKVYAGGDLLTDNSPFGDAMTPVQAIDYALSRPGVSAVMVGCKSTEEIDAAVAWNDATDAQRDYLPVLAGARRYSWSGHCMYCGHCAPCSSAIDIAAVNKFTNLAIAQNQLPETVREHYQALARHASDCIECRQCETRCPFSVEIVEGMHRAVKIFGY